MGATAVSRIVSAAASTNATSATTSSTDLCFIFGRNTSAADKYLKLYDKASAPTVGTDTPVMTLVLPLSAAFAFDFANRMKFARGLAYAITGAAADADTTNLTAGDVTGLNIGYS